MANFIVRVELHGSDDYSGLHAAMKSYGFSRKIRSRDGIWYKLPSGMYRKKTTTQDKFEVLSDAKSAANSVDEDSPILVVQSAGTTWSNLESLT